MAQQTINVGTVANDGTGDTIRGAMTKVNANFTELYNVVGSELEPSGMVYVDSNGTLANVTGLTVDEFGTIRYDRTSNSDSLAAMVISDTLNTVLTLVEYSGSSSNAPALALVKRRGSISAPEAPIANDLLGVVSVIGIDGDSSGRILWKASSTSTDSNTNSTFEVQTKVNGTLGTRFAINESGQVIVDSIQFSDSTVQTTAASAGLSTVDVPASSFGSSGDQEGDLAFSSTHMYYCSADHTEVTWDNTATVDIAGGDGVSSGIAVTLSVVPSVGWAISDGTTTATITQVVPQGSWYVLLWDNAITFAVGDTVYYGATAPAQDHIWKRVAWSNDTW